MPQWSDMAHHLETIAEVVLLVQACSGGSLRWLQIQGTANPVDAHEWNGMLPHWHRTLEPDVLYLVARVTPHRIDLIDEDQGWGVQDTLEF